MKRIMYHIVMVTIILLWSSFCVMSKPFLPFGAANNQQATALSKHSTRVDQIRGIQVTPRPVSDSTEEGSERRGEEKGIIGYKEALRGLSRLGSRPPGCEHKCGECNPCDPIQIPTNKDHSLRLYYANYEPEGWKCKCGDSYFNP